MERHIESASTDFQNEVQLLLSCARTHMSSPMRERICALASGPIDWEICLSAAGRHGVLPLVCHTLLAECSELLPEEFQRKFKDTLFRVMQRNLFLAAEMLRLAGRFRDEGLLAIPYKGPVLASQAYGNLALREFADLDFAIRQRDIPRACALLLADGYEAAFGKISSDESVQPTHSEYQFDRAAGQVIVEMQTETTLRYFPRPLDFDSFERRLGKVSMGGGEALSFSPEDTLLLLAVHGAKHFWQRLLWIADIAEVVQAPGGIDWQSLFARAEEMRVKRMVHLALNVASLLLDAPLPEEASNSLKGDPNAGKLARAICAQFSVSPLDPPVFQRFRFRVASRDSFWQGLRHAAQLATSLTEPDRKDLPLSGKHSNLHKWLRPFLLLRRYGVRRSKTRTTP